MNKEVRTFIGIAAAVKGNEQGYPNGERHAFNLFLSQEIGAEENLEKAAGAACFEGWTAVEFQRTGVLSEESVRSSGEPFISMYETALNDGSALLVYREPES